MKINQNWAQSLSAIELKKIARSRGFTTEQSFKTLWESDVGLQTVISSLTRLEITGLHLLHALDRCVELPFFASFYPEEDERTKCLYNSFTARYRGLFTLVKEHLAHRGLVAYCLESDLFGKKSQLECWKFEIHPQCMTFLPPLLESTEHSEGPGKWRHEVILEKLAQIEIVENEVRLGGKRFSSQLVRDWQKEHWQRELPPSKSLSYVLEPIEGISYLLATLGKDAWTNVQSLALPLKTFTGDSRIKTEDICEAGWRWGCIEKKIEPQKILYRLAPKESKEFSLDPKILDLKKTPLDVIEQLVCISNQSQTEQPHRLYFVPNLIKIGRFINNQAIRLILDKLKTHSSVWKEALETVNQRYGKTLIHENLSLARVSDLSLKVAIQKAFENQVLSISDEHLLFPQALVSDIRRLVTKSGHFIKEVSA